MRNHATIYKALKNISLVLATIAIPAILATVIWGQSGEPAVQETLVGTWAVTGSASGSPFLAVDSFTSDGTSVAHDNSASPSIETITQGPWRQKESTTFDWAPQNFFFNSSGAYAGVVKSTITITLTSPNTFTSSGTSYFYDANGNFLGSGPVTENGTRLTAK